MASVFIESARFTTDIQRRKIMKRGHGNGDDLWDESCDDSWDDKGRELVLACKEGRLDDVKRLVDEGVPLNRRYYSATWFNRVSPLWNVCWCDHVEVVRFLLDSGADPNYGRDPPLSELCSYPKSNYLAIAQLLLERGADVNAKDPDGWTPLMRAFVRKEPPIALLELLIGKGARVNVASKNDFNALFYAVHSYHVEAAFWLLENGSAVVVGCGQKLVKLIVENNQSDAPRMIGLLRIAWERGVRKIKDEDVMDKIVLSWSPSNHWVYHPSFKYRIKTFLLVWNRMRIKYYGLPRELALFIIQYMSIHETKTVYHRHIEKKG